MSARRSSILKATRAGLVAALVLALPALAPLPARADACPNAAERFGPSANLPDCRAYELVTPMVKEDNSFIFGAHGFPDGEHVYFSSILPLPGARSGSSEAALSSRAATGWITTPLTTAQGPGQLESPNGSAWSRVSFTSDFSAAFIQSAFAADPRDQNLQRDVYRVDIPSGAVSLESLPDTGPMTEELYAPPPGVTYGEESPLGSYPAGNSADGSEVFFETPVRLPTAPGTPVDTHLSGNELYERRDGHTYVVGVLPDGSVAPCGAETGNGGSTGADYYTYIRDNAVSPDGSNVVFHTYASAEPYAPECGHSFKELVELGGLYLRENNGTPLAKTVELPGKFYLGRTADGLKVLSDGGPGGNAEGGSIYEYNITTGQVTIVGHGGLVAYSADGSVVYSLTNLQDGPLKEEGFEGGKQLRVYDNGTTRTVTETALGAPGYEGGYYEVGRPSLTSYDTQQLPVVTPDGSKLLFLDRSDLTGYDSFGPTCNEGRPGDCAEAYLYDLNTGSFTCISCNPSGAPPLANTSLYTNALDTFLPPTVALLSEDGSRAFFQTAEALVPQDTNGASDVYEWERGHIYLISSGQGGELGVQSSGNEGIGLSGAAGSTLVGASSSGSDVFIKTTDHLVPQDIEASTAIYDARVDGGFPYTPPGHGCDSGQCQGPQTPAPVFAPPASATFVGLGNPVQEATGPPPNAKAPAHKNSKAPAHKVKRKVRRRGRRRNSVRTKGRK